MVVPKSRLDIICKYLDNPNNLDFDQRVKYFVHHLLQAGELTIPQSSSRPVHTPNPWWTDECKTAIQNRRKAFRKFKSNPMLANLIAFKQYQSQAKRIIKEAEKTSWQNYVNSLNCSTPSSQVWNKL
ncbi:hypothetical protein C0J52_12761 [Blattella germanica]|nr:hypothetical protein C0J52_12761 [Blattella germanica]